MHRILILILLAIGFCAFAVDSSHVILQAKKIRETSVVLGWTQIENAKSYKIFYDEENLIDIKDPTPLLSTDFTNKNELEISGLAAGTKYYFVVHGYDRDGNDLQTSSLPLHASTFHAIGMDIAGDPIVIDDKTVALSFTRPIDVSKSEIMIKNTVTNKDRSLEPLKTDSEDLRKVIISLKGTLTPGESHEIIIKKIASTGGLELSADKRSPLSIVWSSAPSDPVVEPVASEVVPEIPVSPVTETDPVEEPVPEALPIDPAPELPPLPVETKNDLTEPVPIDHLPQTGPMSVMLLLLASTVAFLMYKKSPQRIED